MTSYFNLKNYILVIVCLVMCVGNALAKESSSFAEMPKTCQNIRPEQLTFNLPLSIHSLSSKEQQKIRMILNDARTQACILQMQYDGLIQQLVAMLFENKSVSEEQLKPFNDQFISLIQNRIDIRVKTILLIQKVVSEKEWQALMVAYTHFTTVKNEFVKQQVQLQHSYDVLIDGNSSSESITTALRPLSVCVEMHPKIKIVEQVISKLSLTNIQEGKFNRLIQQQERDACAAHQDINNAAEQLFKILPISSDAAKEKQYHLLLKKLITKEYLLEKNQIYTISSLFQLLTPEQKAQLREQYMLVKEVL